MNAGTGAPIRPPGRLASWPSDGQLARALSAVTEPAVIATDLRGLITFFNAGAERLLGHRAREVVGLHTIDHLLHEVGPAGAGSAVTEAFAEVIAAAWDGHRTPYARAGTCVAKDGGRVPVELSLSAVRDETGDPVGLMVVVQESAARDRARHDFVATASHDLRTPLTSIISCLELLLDSALDRLCDQDHELLAAIHRNAHRMLNMVGDLLTLSEAESCTLVLRREPVGVRRVVERAIESVAPNLAGRRLDVRTALPDRPLLVDGDLDYLERALVNLLTNAIKFTPDGGRIRVSAGRADGPVLLRVSDTGVGIPPDELVRVFQRFFRSARTRETVPGTGLGLAIVKAVVEAHDGRIDVRSEPGNGTEFTISLPAYPPDADSSFP